ncbi:MAG: NAD(P)H-dependent oxidoreductase subunit E, partial [bacterium]|nr:NAD(P)H-dependent oxidoreductase subunit E [bacterium]
MTQKNSIDHVGIDNILKQYSGASRDSLIPILQYVQDHLGFLSQDAVVQI